MLEGGGGAGFVYIIFLLPLKVQRFFFYYTSFVYQLLRQLQSLHLYILQNIMKVMEGGEELLKVIKLLRI